SISSLSRELPSARVEQVLPGAATSSAGKNLAPEPRRRAAALPMETPAVRKASGFAPARDVPWQREARPAHRMNGQPNGLARGEVFRSTLPDHPHPPGPNRMVEFRCGSGNCNAGCRQPRGNEMQEVRA